MFKTPYTYHVSLPSFNEGIVRRIVEVAEKVNHVPYHFADLVLAKNNGYSLRVNKAKPHARGKGKGRNSGVTGYVRFNTNGRVISTGGFDLPITLFA